jgi:hypothetical protein
VDVLPDFWGVLLKLDIVAVVFASATAIAFIFLAFKLYVVCHIFMFWEDA